MIWKASLKHTSEANSPLKNKKPKSPHSDFSRHNPTCLQLLSQKNQFKFFRCSIHWTINVPIENTQWILNPAGKKLEKLFRLAQVRLEDCSLSEVRPGSLWFDKTMTSCWEIPHLSCSRVLFIITWFAQQCWRCGTSHASTDADCDTPVLPMPLATLPPTSAELSEIEVHEKTAL